MTQKSLWGKAKEAFNKVRTSPPPVKPVEQSVGRSSKMVAESQPGLAGPKPPAGIGQAVKQQEFQRKIAQEHAAARAAQGREIGKIHKPVINSVDLEQGKKLHEKFRAAAREKDRGKGR